MFSKTTACIVVAASLFFVAFGSLAMVQAMEHDSTCPFSVMSGSDCHAVESPLFASLHHLSMARLIGAASLMFYFSAFFALLAYIIMLTRFVFEWHSTRCKPVLFSLAAYTVVSAGMRFIRWFSKSKPLYQNRLNRVYVGAS